VRSEVVIPCAGKLELANFASLTTEKQPTPQTLLQDTFKGLKHDKTNPQLQILANTVDFYHSKMDRMFVRNPVDFLSREESKKI
jgi:hypothetical protein